MLEVEEKERKRKEEYICVLCIASGYCNAYVGVNIYIYIARPGSTLTFSYTIV